MRQCPTCEMILFVIEYVTMCLLEASLVVQFTGNSLKRRKFLYRSGANNHGGFNGLCRVVRRSHG